MRNASAKTPAASREATFSALRKASLQASIRALAFTNFRLDRSLKRCPSIPPPKR